VPDDYSPVVEQGELEPGSGLRARLRRREELAPLGAGFVRVLLAEDGTPLVGDKQLTPGEKRYMRARSWIRVDVGHHRLDYGVDFSDPSGRADFTATIAVDVAVCDAVELVRQGVTNVRDVLEPALRRAVADVGESGEAPAAESVDDQIAALTTMRQRARARIRGLEEQPLRGLPSWVTATVVSTVVDFDEGTRSHYDQLVRLAQQGQVIGASAKNDELRTIGELTVRRLWREDLLPHLSDPSRRVFEQAFAKPTAENIAMAVGQANQREMVLLQEVVRSFETMAKEGIVEKDDPGIRAFVGLVQRLPEMLPGGGGSALDAGTPSAALGADSAAPVDAEAEAETEVVPPPEAQSGDRDFSD
jgi:hypothetical protein